MAESEIKGMAKPDDEWYLRIPMAIAVRSEGITVHVVSEEKIEQLASSGNQIHLPMFCLAFGIASTVIITLYSNGVTENAKPIFWMVFYATSLLTFYFGLMAVREHRGIRRLKKTILRETEKTITPTY